MSNWLFLQFYSILLTTMKIFHLLSKQTGTRPVHVTIPKRYVYFWEISHYLTQKFDVYSMDCISPDVSIFDIGKKALEEKPRVVVMLVRIENLRQTIKTAQLLRSTLPETKILVYGDVVNLLPDYFKSKDVFDAVVTSGDWELSIEEYVTYVERNNPEPKGLFVRGLEAELPGRNFAGPHWMFPDVTTPLFETYDALNKKKQLSFTVARGCPFNCRFCLSVKTFGAAERRKDVEEVLSFIKENTARYDSFKLFAPTLTLNHAWVKEFSKRMVEEGIKTAWAGSSRIDCLDDEELIRLMSEAGCYKISVGLETIHESSRFLKKEFSRESIERVAGYFNKYGVVLKGLIMLGVPGQKKEDIKELFELMEKNNIKIRPTSYSPLDELAQKEHITAEEIETFDKLTYYKYGIERLSQAEYYQLILNPYSYKEILK